MIEYNIGRTRGFELLEIDGVKGITPTRGTPESAGYDFYNIKEMQIAPFKITLISTNVTSYMRDGEFLDLRIRSSLAKRGLILLNGGGVIDSDYYGNPIGFLVMNLSESPIELRVGDRIGQGIFTNYLKADNDLVLNSKRSGGFGSTGN